MLKTKTQWVKDLNRQFSKEDVQTPIDTWKVLHTLIIRDIQIKTTMITSHLSEWLASARDNRCW